MSPGRTVKRSPDAPKRWPAALPAHPPLCRLRAYIACQAKPAGRRVGGDSR